MYPYVHIIDSYISTFNLMIGLGLVLALLLFNKICKENHIPPTEYDNLMMIIAFTVPVSFIFGMLFDKLAHFKSLNDFIDNLFKYTGMTFLGGLIDLLRKVKWFFEKSSKNLNR